MLNSISRKKGGAATSKGAGFRARCPRRVRPALDVLEGRMVLSFVGSESLVNPPDPGVQFDAVGASSANGTSVAVWVSQFSATDHDIYAQRYDTTGAKVGPVIPIETSGTDAIAPTVAMDANGNFVVAWENFYSTSGNADIMARYYSATGVDQTGPLTVAGSSKTEFNPDVAASNGSFVVSYTLNFSSTDQDVRAHRYTVSGGTVTDAGDFGVATTGAEDETSSSVAMAPDGSFDVAYQSTFNGNGADHDILISRFSPTGAVLASATIVQNSSLDEQSPDVAMDNAGNAVVAYQKASFATGYTEVKARRVSNAGVVGPEIAISSSPTGQKMDPSVALAPTGGAFVVAYESLDPKPPVAIEVAEVSATDQVLTKLGPVTGASPSVSIDGFNRYMVAYTKAVDSSNVDAFTRRALLTSFDNSEAPIVAPGTTSQFGTATASSANGTSVVVWVNGTAVFNHDILAQRYDKFGAPVGHVIQVDAGAADSSEPTVAMDANGNFVVAWVDGRASGNQGDVRVRAFDATGNARTGALTVAGSPKSEYDPDVAASNGSFVVSYTMDYSSTDQDVRAHRYTVTTHGVVGDAGDFAVATSGQYEYAASVAMAPDGSFAIAYDAYSPSTGDDILLNRYSPTGAAIASGVVVAGSANTEQSPDIAMDNAGNAVIAYRESGPLNFDFDIRARRVSSTGVVGGEINVRSTSRDEDAPSVALAPTGGQFVVSYEADGQAELAEVSATDSVKAILGPVEGREAKISIDGLGRYTVSYEKFDAAGQLHIFRRRDFLS
jgi:hypothetical protein